MITPRDIEIADPDEGELPYAGLLFFNSTYISVAREYSDKLSTVIGIVGPASLAEESQKFVHEMIGAAEPLGRDTQLDNEVVFQFSLARVWRTWVSASGGSDLLLDGEASLGTISSSASAGLTLRFGDGLLGSYPSLLLSSSRISNPLAVNTGWQLYAGIKASYLFNQIFTDGNTFEDSRSIDYDPERIAISLGYSYAWRDWSITFAINDSGMIADKSREQLEDLSRFGTITVSWRG